MDEPLVTREQANRTSANFLKTDLQTALTFTKIAGETDDDCEKKT